MSSSNRASETLEFVLHAPLAHRYRQTGFGVESRVDAGDKPGSDRAAPGGQESDAES